MDRTARVWDALALTGEPLGPPLKHDTYVWRAEFSPDGQRILTTSEDNTDHKFRVWVWYLAQDSRPAADLLLLAQLLDGRKLDPNNDVVSMEPEALRGAWQTLKARYPETFAALPEETRLWHQHEAVKDEAAHRWFAARFHLDKLVAAYPFDQTLQARRSLADARVNSADEK